MIFQFIAPYQGWLKPKLGYTVAPDPNWIEFAGWFPKLGNPKAPPLPNSAGFPS